MLPKRIVVAVLAAVLALISLKSCGPNSSLLVDVPQPHLASAEATPD